MPQLHLASALSLIGLTGLLGCETVNRIRGPEQALLRTDSAEVGVRFTGIAYAAKIGFLYVNTTDGAVSMAGCGGPPSPEVEKKVSGRWVVAYYPFYAMCRTIPDFSFDSGAKFHGEVDFFAFEPGHNTLPILKVDSIDGVYRLRWTFAKGRVADAKDARRVEAISNEFRMVLRK